jgi:hypothetical protein
VVKFVKILIVQYNAVLSKEHEIALLALGLVEIGTDSGRARWESRIISHTHPWILFLVDRVSLWHVI